MTFGRSGHRHEEVKGYRALFEREDYNQVRRGPDGDIDDISKKKYPTKKKRLSDVVENLGWVVLYRAKRDCPEGQPWVILKGGYFSKKGGNIDALHKIK